MRKSRRAKKKQKKIIFLVVFLVILFFSVGYAILQQNLNIFGTATIDTSYYDNSEISYTCTKILWTSKKYDYQFDCTVKNNSNKPIKKWIVILNVPKNTTLTTGWGATVTLASNIITVKSNAWDTLNAGASTVFHVQISHKTNGTIDFPGGDATNNDEIVNDPGYNITDGLSAIIRQTSHWDKYYQYEIVVTNKSGVKLMDWELKLSVPSGTVVNNFWNNNYIHAGNIIIITPTWNNVINNNNSINFSFQLEYTGTNFNPTIVSIKGSES